MIACKFENGNEASLRHVVVNVILVRDGKILLGRRAKHLTAGGKWGLPGGFMDRDETSIEAAKRETFEETGWTIKDIELFRIVDTPNLPNEDRQNVKLIFVALAGDQQGVGDLESENNTWFPLDATPSIEDIAFDHAENIGLYREHLTRPKQLPLFG